LINFDDQSLSIARHSANPREGLNKCMLLA
jgi:hypothetical protein